MPYKPSHPPETHWDSTPTSPTNPISKVENAPLGSAREIREKIKALQQDLASLEHSESVWIRYKCTCSQGFTRVYQLGGAGSMRCQKCHRTTGLTEVPCTRRKRG